MTRHHTLHVRLPKMNALDKAVHRIEKHTRIEKFELPDVLHRIDRTPAVSKFRITLPSFKNVIDHGLKTIENPIKKETDIAIRETKVFAKTTEKFIIDESKKVESVMIDKIVKPVETEAQQISDNVLSTLSIFQHDQDPTMTETEPQQSQFNASAITTADIQNGTNSSGIRVSLTAGSNRFPLFVM